MEFGLQVNGLELPRLRDVAQAAEELGFEFLTLPDHYLYEGPEKAANPSLLNFDPMIAAAVMAQATKTARIGHLVLCNLFRHPLETARAISTLDHLSGGRAVLGIGSGWTASEFEMTGIPYPEIGPRLRQLDEGLQCIRSLWEKEQTTFDGEFYHLRDAIQNPKPVQKPHPPILLGGGGRGLLRVAARHADVVNLIPETGRSGYISMAEVSKLTDESFRAKTSFLHQCARDAGRDPAKIRLSMVAFQVALTQSPDETRQQAEMMASFLQTTPNAILCSPSTLIGTPDEMVKELRRRRDAWGISQVIFSFSGEQMMERLGKEVLPPLRGA